MQHDYHFEPYERKSDFSQAKLIIIFSLISLIVLYLAYTQGLLPHYTLVVEGNTVTFVRDDPAYLAEQKKIEDANRQIYKVNGVEVSEEEYNAALQHNQRMAEQQIQSQTQPENPQQSAPEESDQYHSGSNEVPTGQAVKCLDASNRVVYQAQPCSATGLRKTDMGIGAVSNAQTYSYKDAEARKEANTVYKVDGRVVSKAEFDAVQEHNKRVKKQNEAQRAQYCQSLEQRRENLRSMQRVDSNQWYRDEYNRLSKEWQDKCLGWTQAWS
ncbi:hypothetical protein [Chitinibacter tainanensis]|uniref:hypothetical protein n=1 Tax=Chitinibacter tainanensis TaxID=230667 RepID=UPI000422246C|nr:hypothetical protein [Chitinibacter tainanensis]